MAWIFDQFGHAVALSADGNTALISAHRRTGAKGAAYLFVRGGTTWAQQPTPPLTASDGVTGDFFGWSLALSADGNTGIISADEKNAIKGEAYFFATPTLHFIAPASSPAGSPFSLTLSITDPTGVPFASYPEPVHFSSSDPHATLPADYSFTLADNGTHVFTNAATLTTAGAQTITVTDPTVPTITAHCLPHYPCRQRDDPQRQRGHHATEYTGRFPLRRPPQCFCDGHLWQPRQWRHRHLRCPDQ